MSTITARQYEEALRDWLGDRVVFRDGWETLTSNGGFDAHGVLHHWTAMSGIHVPAGSQERLLAVGRSDLPGPLCHMSPRRSGIVAVIAGPHANANHAGAGDPAVWARVLAGTFNGTPAPRVDTVDGNERLYGFEYQFHPADGHMPDEQVEAGILAAAALAEAHGWSPADAAGSNLDHYEWTARKTDRQLDGLADRTRKGVREALVAGRPGSHPNTPAPTPAGPAASATMKGGTWNLHQGRAVDTVVAEVVEFVTSEDLDFLAVQEASSYLGRKMRRALREHGYKIGRAWAPDRSARDSAIITRKTRRAGGARMHRLGGIGWERGKGRPGLHWPRTAQSLRVDWLRVLDVHQPPGPFGPAFPLRRKANEKGYQRVARIVTRWIKRGISWVGPGDWNREPSDPVVKAFIAATGAEVTGSGIDWIASHGVTVSNVRKHKFGTSDHRPVTFTVERAK